MTSVAIIHGFAEGKYTSNLLTKALTKEGFGVTDDTESADIIITHSGGCYYLPDTPKDQLVFLVGPPYWPGKPMIGSLAQKLYGDFTYHRRHRKLGFWLKKNSWNFLYIFGDIPHTFQLMLFARHHDFHERLVHTKFILIRNKNDSFCMPDVEHIPFGNKKIDFYELQGEHDDIWVNPQPYIDIIRNTNN